MFVGISCLFILAGCGADDEIANFEAAPEKYSEPPEDGPVDLSIPPDAILTEEIWVEVPVGESLRKVFPKEAGKHYTIGLSELTADLDMFGHWLPDVSRSFYQFPSWAWGTTDEQIDFTATEDGEYYLAIHGFEAGGGRLQIYASDPAESDGDEVGWPVEWGYDEIDEKELLGGGLSYLESYDYGPGCGKTPHPGLDMNHGSGAYGDLGLPVMAVADGVVSGAGYSARGWGNVVTIEHTLTDQTRFESLYGHLEQFDVSVGETVSKGQVIATIGKPPNSTPHLHFEIRSNLGLTTFQFPCSWAKYSVEEAYDNPADFIRYH